MNKILSIKDQKINNINPELRAKYKWNDFDFLYSNDSFNTDPNMKIHVWTPTGIRLLKESGIKKFVDNNLFKLLRIILSMDFMDKKTPWDIYCKSQWLWNIYKDFIKDDKFLLDEIENIFKFCQKEHIDKSIYEIIFSQYIMESYKKIKDLNG